MTKDELREKIIGALREVAPEIEPEDVEMDAAFQDQFDLDSVDILNFTIKLHEKFAIEIPQADYKNFQSLAQTIKYLDARV